jgi:hypothetical protein
MERYNISMRVIRVVKGTKDPGAGLKHIPLASPGSVLGVKRRPENSCRY